MANKIDNSKLLPSSKSSAIVPYQKPNISGKRVVFTSNIKPIKLERKSSAIVKQSTDENLNEIGGKLVKIEKFLGSELTVYRRQQESKRKEEEQQDFQKAEEKLEEKKPKGFKFPKFPQLPKIDFFERIKRFIFFTALGRFLPAILDFAPKLEGIVKTIGTVYGFAENLFGKLLDGFTSLVKFGGDLKDKTIGFFAQAGLKPGEKFQDKFDNLEKQFNKFVDASIVAGLLGLDIGLAAVDEWKKWKGTPEPRKGGKPITPRGKVDVTEGQGGKKGLGKKVTVSEGRGGEKGLGAKVALDVEKEAGKKPKFFQKLTGPLAKLKAPLGKLLGAAALGAGAAFSEYDARQRFASGDNVGGWMARISSILSGFAGISAIAGLLSVETVIGAPLAAVLAGVAGIAEIASIVIDVALFVKDIIPIIGPMMGPVFGFAFDKIKGFFGFSRGGRIIRGYQKGGTTGGKLTKAPPKRTINVPRRKKPLKIRPQKTQPGKDVGGENKIKKLYPDTDPKKLNVSQWMEGDFAGTYKDYIKSFGKDGDKKPNPFKALTDTSKALKPVNLIGGILGAGVDLALGQKPDKKVFTEFFNGIGYFADNMMSQQLNRSVSSISKELSSFASGGTVPASRELKQTGDNLNFGETLAKVLGPIIDQSFNEALQSIRREVNKKPPKEEGAGAGGDLGGPGLEGGGGEYTGKAADIPPEGKALLDAIAGAEARDYNIVVGGGTFSSYADHPRQFNRSAGSDAAGRYQFLSTTWDKYKPGKAFTPENQDIAAWRLAIAVYGEGESGLIRDLKKDPMRVAEKLRGTWPSLPGGSQENAQTKGFLRRYNDSVKRYTQGTGSSSALAEAAKNLRGMSTISGPSGGRNACVWAVNQVFKKAGITPPWGNSDYVPTAENSMINSGYTRIKRGEQKPGDLYIVKGQEHIGIVLQNGNILSNSSSGAKFSWEASLSSYESYYGGQGKFYRMPVSTNTKTSTPTISKIIPYSESVKTLQNRIINMKFGDAPIAIPNVGKVIIKKNQYGTIIKEYRDVKGKLIDSDNFFKLYESRGKQGVQSVQSGGLISPSKPNRPIPNSFASYENYGQGPIIAIQPIIIEKTTPTYSPGTPSIIAFPVPVGVNNIKDALSFSRG